LTLVSSFVPYTKEAEDIRSMISEKELNKTRTKIRQRKLDRFIRAVYRLEWSLEDLGVVPDLAPGSDKLQDAGDTLLTALQFVRAEQKRRTPKAVQNVV
jgi:hypothetical protein